MRKIHTLGLGLLLLAGLSACFPDRFEVAEPEDWNPAFGVPLIQTAFSVDDLLEALDEGSLVQSDAANRLAIVYQERLQAVPEFEVELPPLIPITVTEKEQAVAYEPPDGRRFELIRLKSGRFQYTVLNPHPEAVEFTLIFSNLRLNGSSLTVSATLPAANANTPSETTGVIDLSGYEAVLDEDITTTYTAYLLPDNAPVDLPPFLVTVEAADYTYVQGYLGQFPVELPGDSLSFGLLDDWEGGMLELLEPSIKLTFYNTMGVPLELQAEMFDLHTFQNGIVPLDNPLLNEGLLFAFPDVEEAGQAKATQLVLNAGNSNIVDAVSGIPYQLNYALGALANPNDNPFVTNHLTDSVRLDVDVEVEIPLYLKARAFEIRDTFEVDLADFEDLDRLGFKMIAENGFPLEAGLQLHFLDASEAVFDSLFQEGPRLIASGAQRSDGTVSASRATTFELEMQGRQLEEVLSRTAHAKIIATLASPNEGQEAARMLDAYTLAVRLGVLAGL